MTSNNSLCHKRITCKHIQAFYFRDAFAPLFGDQICQKESGKIMKILGEKREKKKEEKKKEEWKKEEGYRKD